MIRTLSMVSALSCAFVSAQDPIRIQLEPFATGLSGPVDIAHCGDDRLFVVEQAGVIKIIGPDGVVSPTPFMDITDIVNDGGGEQGLLGLAFDPDYATNGEFYVYYTAGTGNGTDRLSRFTVSSDPNVADEGSEEIIYDVVDPAGNHNGGDIDFGPDGYLYVGFGDGGSANDPWNNAQTLTNSALGDMIRIDVHGAEPFEVPATNPWVNAGNDTLPEIWASGLRNPWRWGFDALTGDLWIGDVGQNVWEEVDFWPAGDNSGPNFGWRCREGLVPTPSIDNPDCPGASAFVSPVSVHSHSAGWCSVIGGRVYRGAQFPHLFGHYLYTDYCPTAYFSLYPDGNGGFTRTQVLTSNGGAGTSCIAENSALELFVANVNNGTIKRIVDACPMDAPVVTQSEGTLTSTEADTYTWYFNDAVIPGASTQSIFVTESGDYHVVGGFANNCQLESSPVQVISTGIGGHGSEIFGLRPIPASEVVTIPTVPTGVALVRIVDMSGREVASHAVKAGSTATLNVADLADATYIVRLVDANGSLVQQRMMQVQH
ncbi:MAG: PQQ-dependent sugar dehydrogenase [Flavobacteriales bacterium]|nr:PQQ-dependent sugar dehydrogenase [Flavobacteriales bacterium]